MLSSELKNRKDWAAMPDTELIEQADLSDAEFDALETELRLRAACLQWTGDPLKQPVAVVASVVRRILSERR